MIYQGNAQNSQNPLKNSLKQYHFKLQHKVHGVSSYPQPTNRSIKKEENQIGSKSFQHILQFGKKIPLNKFKR